MARAVLPAIRMRPPKGHAPKRQVATRNQGRRGEEKILSTYKCGLLTVPICSKNKSKTVSTTVGANRGGCLFQVGRRLPEYNRDSPLFVDAQVHN